MKKLFQVSVSFNFEMYLAADDAEKAQEAAQSCADLALASVNPDVGPPFRVRGVSEGDEARPVYILNENGEAEELEGVEAGAYCEALREYELRPAQKGEAR